MTGLPLKERSHVIEDKLPYRKRIDLFARSNVSKIDAPEYEGWSGRPHGGSILFRFDPWAGVTFG
jgi:hypothetical protein